MNQTSDSIEVECSENFDGGLPQYFSMELIDRTTMKLKRNVSTSKVPPVFYLEEFEPGSSYDIHLYAINAKGKSDVTVISYVVFKGVAKFASKLILRYF